MNIGERIAGGVQEAKARATQKEEERQQARQETREKVVMSIKEKWAALKTKASESVAGAREAAQRGGQKVKEAFVAARKFDQAGGAAIRRGIDVAGGTMGAVGGIAQEMTVDAIQATGREIVRGGKFAVTTAVVLGVGAVEGSVGIAKWGVKKAGQGIEATVGFVETTADKAKNFLNEKKDAIIDAYYDAQLAVYDRMVEISEGADKLKKRAIDACTRKIESVRSGISKKKDEVTVAYLTAVNKTKGSIEDTINRGKKLISKARTRVSDEYHLAVAGALSLPESAAGKVGSFLEKLAGAANGAREAAAEKRQKQQSLLSTAEKTKAWAAQYTTEVTE